MMRKPAKSVLRKFLLSKTECSLVAACSMYVVDGGALLHRVMWPQRATYADVIQEYMKFVAYKYGRKSSGCVVFDGYQSENSTKVHKQFCRGSATVTANVSITKDKTATSIREMFLT